MDMRRRAFYSNNPRIILKLIADEVYERLKKHNPIGFIEFTNIPNKTKARSIVHMSYPESKLPAFYSHKIKVVGHKYFIGSIQYMFSGNIFVYNRGFHISGVAVRLRFFTKGMKRSMVRHTLLKDEDIDVLVEMIVKNMPISVESKLRQMRIDNKRFGSFL